MMTALAYLVCLRIASKNFTLNNRLPTFTIPILCKGSGWCTSEPDRSENKESSDDIELLPTHSDQNKEKDNIIQKLMKSNMDLRRIMKQKEAGEASFKKNSTKKKKQMFGPVSSPVRNAANSIGSRIPFNFGFESRSSEFEEANPNRDANWR